MLAVTLLTAAPLVWLCASSCAAGLRLACVVLLCWGLQCCCHGRMRHATCRCRASADDERHHARLLMQHQSRRGGQVKLMVRARLPDWADPGTPPRLPPCLLLWHTGGVVPHAHTPTSLPTPPPPPKPAPAVSNCRP